MAEAVISPHGCGSAAIQLCWTQVMDGCFRLREQKRDAPNSEPARVLPVRKSGSLRFVPARCPSRPSQTGRRPRSGRLLLGEAVAQTTPEPGASIRRRDNTCHRQRDQPVIGMGASFFSCSERIPPHHHRNREFFRGVQHPRAKATAVAIGQIVSSMWRRSGLQQAVGDVSRPPGSDCDAAGERLIQSGGTAAAIPGEGQS